MNNPMLERFWAKVDKNGPVTKDELGVCWIWTGSVIPRKGYGNFHYGQKNGKPFKRRAHRVSYELAYGPVTEGLHVCHKCDNPRCVRPDHLFLGTNQDNMDDMKSKNRSPVNIGARNPNSVLVEDDVRRIRKQRIEGLTYKVIAAEWNITPEMVSNICRRVNWKHVS